MLVFNYSVPKNSCLFSDDTMCHCEKNEQYYKYSITTIKRFNSETLAYCNQWIYEKNRKRINILISYRILI